MRNFVLNIIMSIISPTYVRATLKKDSTLSDLEKRAVIIRKLNTQYLIISIVFALILTFYRIIENINKFVFSIILFTMLYYSFSRINEIFMAFIKDAKDKMKYKPQVGKGLSYADRLILALKSYLELMINYGIIYYILNFDIIKKLYLNKERIFNTDFDNLIEAIYYSASTITTVGYGDIFPTTTITQVLSIYEVINGLLLLVVSFTIYVNLNFIPHNNLREVVNKSNEINKTKYNWNITVITLVINILLNSYYINKYIVK